MVDPFVGMLDEYPPEVKAVSEALRAVIKNAMPEAVETFSPEQRHLSYSTQQQEILLLAPKKNFVFLVFKGSKGLQDASGLLGSDGKQVRFMTVKTVEQANGPELNDLIHAAWTNMLTAAK